MRKWLFLFCCITSNFFAGAQVVKVEHFNAHSARAADLFELFKTTFRLPVAFDYQGYGNFSSGGLWLGNCTLEFVNQEGLPPAKAIFKGIALEPVQHGDTVIQMLDEYGVAHLPATPAKFKMDNVEKTSWTTTVLKDLSSEDLRVFVCDYTDRNFVNAPKKAGSKKLEEEKGGPLGIIRMKKIVINAADMDKTLSVWTSIPGTKRAGNHFIFFDGPEVVIEKAAKDGIKEIVVQVRSAENASKFLADNHLLFVENTSTLIDPEKLFGLRIILEQ